LYGLRFRKKSKKGFLEYNKLILVASWSLNGIFKILDISHNDFFQVMGSVAFIIWIIMEGTTYLVDDKEDDRSDIAYFMWNTMMIIGILAIIIGSLTKILEWEYATPTLITGSILVALYVLKDLLVQNLQKKE
jgi:surface polysaccharide O-acyltransferase-like enzyme